MNGFLALGGLQEAHYICKRTFLIPVPDAVYFERSFLLVQVFEARHRLEWNAIVPDRVIFVRGDRQRRPIQELWSRGVLEHILKLGVEFINLASSGRGMRVMSSMRYSLLPSVLVNQYAA